MTIGVALGVGATGTWVALESETPRERGTAPQRLPSSSAFQAPGAAMPSGASGVVPNGRPSLNSSTPQRERVASREVDPLTAATGREILPSQAPSVSVFPENDSTRGAAKTESAGLAQARSLLRKNEPRAALAMLERVQRDHPQGVLVQEREVLAIEALLSLGEQQAARRRAQDFLRQYPTSPHTASARRALEHSEP